MQNLARIFAASALCALVLTAHAQIDIGTTDASDGDLTVGPYPHTLDLAKAATHGR